MSDELAGVQMEQYARVEGLLKGISDRLDDIKEHVQRVESAQVTANSNAAAVDRRVTTLEADLRNTQRELAEAKLASAIASKEQGERLGKVEQKLWTLAGGAATVGALGAFFLSKLFGG